MAGDVSTVEQLPKSFSRTKAVAARELQEALSSAEVSLEEKEIAKGNYVTLEELEENLKKRSNAR